MTDSADEFVRLSDNVTRHWFRCARQRACGASIASLFIMLVFVSLAASIAFCVHQQERVSYAIKHDLQAPCMPRALSLPDLSAHFARLPASLSRLFPASLRCDSLSLLFSTIRFRESAATGPCCVSGRRPQVLCCLPLTELNTTTDDGTAISRIFVVSLRSCAGVRMLPSVI